MGTEMGTARGDADTNADDADEILRLIMSGQRPKSASPAPSDTVLEPSGRPAGVSPVDADPFWAAPPTTSNDTAPRVEAVFTRGVNYEPPEPVVETEDIASIGDEEIVAELAPVPAVDAPAEEIEAIEASEPLVADTAAEDAALVVEASVDEEPVIEEPVVVEAPVRKPSSFRPLPTPQSRMLGADYLRDVDEFDEFDVIGSTEAEEHAADQEPASTLSLDAAIDPYVRESSENADEATAARDELRDTWHKS